jgi:glycosyltransferase involved in cell wall biosynthesis
MVILHLLAPVDVGGLERVVRALAVGQHELGHDAHVGVVVEPSHSTGEFTEPLRRAGVPVHEIRIPARGYIRERKAVAGLCRELSLDVVHTHGYRPDVLDAPVARRLGVPTVTTAHGFTRGDPKNRFYEWLQRHAFGRFAAVVAVSRALGREIQEAGVPRGRVHVIPNAWVRQGPVLPRGEGRRILGIAEAGFRIGWVGRLSREKGADIMLEALGRLRDLPVEASMVGTGRDAPRLRQQARQLGIESLVRWHHGVADAARIFGVFDLFVLSSRTEGTPIVLFEAMEARVPIVATRVGGVPDVVGETDAFLVPSEDPVALADAIRTAFEDRAAACQRARRAHERLIREFAPSQWLAAYAAVYRHVEGAQGRRESAASLRHDP